MDRKTAEEIVDELMAQVMEQPEVRKQFEGADAVAAELARRLMRERWVEVVMTMPYPPRPSGHTHPE